MKIRAIIADDEPLLTAHLHRQLCLAWPDIEVIAEVHDGVKALDLIQKEKPDLAFLDIRMPGIDGIELAWHMASKCKIVFVTAWHEHAVDAFTQGALDYIVKPVTSRRLATTIRRLKEHFAQTLPPEQPPLSTEHETTTIAYTPSTPPAASTQHPWICVKTSADTRVIQHRDIIYMQSAGNYVRIVSQNDTGTIRQKLHILMEKLPADTFIQIHRCTMVNALMIKSVHRDNDGARLLLHGTNEELRVSRHYMKHFFGSESV